MTEANDFELPAGWIRASDAPPSKPVDWLIPNRLARGHVTYLYGEEGIGKSTYWVHLVAYLTRLGYIVVIIITEDGWEDTSRPRLEAANANLDNILIFNVAEDDDDFEMGIPGPNFLLEQQLPPVALTVIDGLADATTVINGALPKSVEWRPVLNAWKRFAKKTNSAVVALGHTNRDTLNGTRGAVGLSGQIRQVIRLNLLAQRTEDGHLAIGVEKANICRSDQPVELFEIVETVANGITVTTVNPVGDGEQTAQELFSTLAAQNHVANETDDSVDTWLTAFLADGRKWANDVYSAADANGYSKDMAKRAKGRLKIKAVKDGDRWYWELPDAQEGSSASSACSLAPLHPSSSEGVPTSKGAREQGSKSVEETHDNAVDDVITTQICTSLDCCEVLLSPESKRRGFCERCHLSSKETREENA